MKKKRKLNVEDDRVRRELLNEAHPLRCAVMFGVDFLIAYENYKLCVADTDHSGHYESLFRTNVNAAFNDMLDRLAAYERS